MCIKYVNLMDAFCTFESKALEVQTGLVVGVLIVLRRRLFYVGLHCVIAIGSARTA